MGDIMANLISSGVFDKLIQNQYLHSNTENFVEVVSQHLSTLKKEQMNNALLIEIKERLEKLLNKANEQMNLFYQDISNYYRSIGQMDKIILGRDFYNNGKYYPNGANEFSRKFLINNKSNKNMTDEQVILSIINSIDSRNEIRRIYNNVNNMFLSKNVNFNQVQQKMIMQLQDIFGQTIFPNINEILYNDIEKNINNIFVQNRTKGAYGLKISNKSDKKIQEKINDFLSQLGIENFSARRQKDLDSFKNMLINQLKNKNLFYEVGNQYWNYLNKKFKEKTGKSLHGAKQKKFARFFSDTISKYNVNLIDVRQENSLNGFLLEFGMYASFNLPLNYNQEIVSILGQENIIREYITEEYNLTGQKIKGTKITTGQSPSDIEYKGSSGKFYRFQLKNNFNEVSKALSFRSQAEIKVSTYLSTAFTNLNQNIKDILLYLLINTAFLRKYGLGSYNSNEKITFNPSDYPIIKDYILFFLQQSYQFLIGYQYDKNIQEINGITAGNLAYIFQGKYLIPVAAYFYSALEMIQKILDNTYNLKGIGGISGLPSFKNNSLSIKNDEFQKNKINLLSKLKYNDNIYSEYKYPQGLLEYGGSYGKQLYNNLSFERISIVLIIEKLEKYFK